MNVASLELSKQLAEVSGWDDTDYCYEQWLSKYNASGVAPWQLARTDEAWKDFDKGLLSGVPCFAYDAGFLLRKLPWPLQLLMVSDGGWVASHKNVNIEADTPEDSLTALAIKLFQEGILK